MIDGLAIVGALYERPFFLETSEYEQVYTSEIAPAAAAHFFSAIKREL
jgi:hypothetical protein